MSVTIYHNPRCSKSRQTLALLEEKGITAEVVTYLDTLLSVELLESVLSALGMEPRALMRKGEDTYKDLDLANEDLSRAALITAMIENPILIERPIVVNGSKAAIGRPPESVLEIL